MAGRRAITFLEKQTEVNADRIGYTGFSMGGMITALTAIDPRLKAVAPLWVALDLRMSISRAALWEQ